jgi:hypothetical protein
MICLSYIDIAFLQTDHKNNQSAKPCLFYCRPPESFDIGRDTGTAVTPEYEHRTEFTGTIKRIMIDLAGEKHIDPEAEARMSLVEE